MKLKPFNFAMLALLSSTAFAGIKDTQSNLTFNDLNQTNQVCSDLDKNSEFDESEQGQRCALIKEFLKDGTNDMPKVLDYPVIYVHGFTGHHKKNDRYYFHAAKELTAPLMRAAHPDAPYKPLVFRPRLDPMNSSSIIGSQLVRYLKTVLLMTQSKKVHLIAHSQGALAARYAAGKLCDHLKYTFDCPIASVGSIAGVNYGTSLADIEAIDDMPLKLQNLILPTLEIGSQVKEIAGASLGISAALGLVRRHSLKSTEDPFRSYLYKNYRHFDSLPSYVYRMNRDSKKMTTRGTFSFLNMNKSMNNLALRQMTHPIMIHSFNKDYPNGVIAHTNLVDRVTVTQDRVDAVHPKFQNFAYNTIDAKHIAQNGVFYASWAGNFAPAYDFPLNAQSLMKASHMLFQEATIPKDDRRTHDQGQINNDGLVGNIDSLLGINLGVYDFNHETIINKFSYDENQYYKNYGLSKDQHAKDLKQLRSQLNYRNPEYLFLRYLRILSKLEAFMKSQEESIDMQIMQADVHVDVAVETDAAHFESAVAASSQ